jgi:RHH-type rel operon transcriptional repressor/antitoxin RelB
VRLPPDIIRRIDALAERAGRSRGLFLSLALAAFLPQVEKDHGNQRTTRYEQDGSDRDFQQLMMHLINESESDTQTRTRCPSAHPLAIAQET